MGARGLNAALLPVHERVLSLGHRDILTARANLAYWTGAARKAYSTAATKQTSIPRLKF